MNTTPDITPANHTPIVVLDIGSSSVRAMAVEQNQDGKLRILGIERVNNKPKTMCYGAVTNRSEVGFAISTCLKQLQQQVKTNLQRDIDISNVFISCGSRHSQALTLTAQRKLTNPLISETTLEPMLNECRQNASQQKKGSQEPQAVVYDIRCYNVILDKEQSYDNVQDIIGKRANHIAASFYLVIDKPDKDHQLQELFNTFSYTNTKIRPAKFFSKLEALSTALLTEEDKRNGCVIIDCGAQTTTMIIFRDGHPTRLMVTRLGGDNITRDIAMSCNITENIAEKLKRDFVNLTEQAKNVKLKVINCNTNQPQYIYTSTINNIAAMRVDEIFEDMLKIIDTEADFPQARILLSGNASQLEGLDSYLQRKTNLTVDFANHDTWLVNDTPPKYFDPALSMLVGTAACAFEFIEYESKQKSTTTTDKDKKTSKNNKAGLLDKIQNMWGQRSLFDVLFPEDKDELN